MSEEKNVEENLKRSIISKIYYNELEALEELPNSKEYINITNKIKTLEEEILNEWDDNSKIREYIEYLNERSGIEAEEQFKWGLKTGVQIVIESLK